MLFRSLVTVGSLYTCHPHMYCRLQGQVLAICPQTLSPSKHYAQYSTPYTATDDRDYVTEQHTCRESLGTWAHRPSPLFKNSNIEGPKFLTTRSPCMGRGVRESPVLALGGDLMWQGRELPTLVSPNILTFILLMHSLRQDLLSSAHGHRSGLHCQHTPRAKSSHAHTGPDTVHCHLAAFVA